MGYGHRIEIYKEKGLAADVVGRFGLSEMSGSHGIGHTRMATESAVTTEHSHPFIASSDICLVHNGSLSNHNRLRRRLQNYGMSFETDNDSEVAARYVAYRMNEGASLREALEAALKDIDGFYTFAVGTIDGFAVVRDGIACKPAVMAETDDWVAMASEYRSLAHLPGADTAKVWEPEPAVVYSWGQE
jgi:glutamate synthase domain-containing protein 1